MKQYNPAPAYPEDTQFVLMWEYNDRIWSGVYVYNSEQESWIRYDPTTDGFIRCSYPYGLSYKHTIYVMGD